MEYLILSAPVSLLIFFLLLFYCIDRRIELDELFTEMNILGKLFFGILLVPSCIGFFIPGVIIFGIPYYIGKFLFFKKD